ncbi:MAG: hypothetical protein JW850_23170 [Thermoflexales bacterium]|nr:hypothetical protein [Thermoflexales bacterium]
MADVGQEGTRQVTNPASIVMDGDKVVTATFVLQAVCVDIASVSLTQVTAGTIYTDTPVEFSADIAPDNADKSYTYTINSGAAQISSADPLTFSLTFATAGVHAVELAAWNCAMTVPVTDVVQVTVQARDVWIPLTSIAIAGQSAGSPGIYTFTTAYLPPDASTPITYNWDDGSAATTSVRVLGVGQHVLAVTATNPAGAVVNDTHLVTVTAPPPPAGDAYEDDDTCVQARSIFTDGVSQFHTFHAAGDEDWVAFQAVSGTTYIVEAQTPITSLADVVLEVYDTCSHLQQPLQNPSFSPDIRLRLRVGASGLYYLHMLDNDPDAAGPDVAYRLSVRALPAASTPGALILVAGRLRSSDHLNQNIYNVTSNVYKLFQAHGYTGDRIYYLTTESDVDVDNDGTPDWDALPSKTSLQYAIEQWALDKVSAERALTLYMMDHGGKDYFYLNGSNQTVAPDEIATWLNTLEAARPGLRVNVIVEACHSGSFIDGVKTLSKAGRVVIVSTGVEPLAYASEGGAVFSDAFVGALGTDQSLYNSLQFARGAAQRAYPDQTPWLDDDGDGRPNGTLDGQEAQRRGFAFGGTFPDEKWLPYVAQVQLGAVVQRTVVITAEVRDDRGVVSVWAVIYKPSYQPPLPGDEMQQPVLPMVYMQDLDGDGRYVGKYENMDEAGEYRIVVYTADNDEQQGLPREATLRTGWKVYLPAVVKNVAGGMRRSPAPQGRFRLPIGVD